MVLPPGPMSLPIFSGWMVVESIRGACGESSLGPGTSASIISMIWTRFFLASSKVLLDLLHGEATDFEVELDGGDALCGCR